MKKTIKKSLAVLAAASVCSSMLLNFPSGTFSIHWNWQASAEETEGSVEDVAIDATNFPDETFRTYIQENFDTTADGILSKEEREQVTKIDVRSKGISDLTGVEYFTALQWLVCFNNNLTELDVRQNLALQRLQCHYNNLTELDVSQNTALQTLSCYKNNLTKLDVSQNTALQTLYCDNNNLTELDVSQNTALQLLACYDNNLTALDVSQNPALTDLACFNNTYSIALTGGTFDLSTLPGNFDVSKASDWTNATVDGNTLTVIDLKANVTYTYDLGNGKTATFTLHPASCTLTESMVRGIPEQVYTGSAVTPDVVLQYGEHTLEKDVDYTVSYTDNQHTGTGNAIITGKGTFSGTVTVPFGIGVAINETTFPDETFRTYVKENIDTTPDDILTVSELEQVTMIDVAFKEIADLTGVEYFTALKELYCGGNNLTELDVRQNPELQKLYCYNNQLKELDVRQNTALQILGCNDNQLKELDVHQNTALQILECSSNQLTELDVRQNTALQELHCYNNNLTELNVCKNTELQTLWCSSNNLTVLDVRQNTALQVLYCYNNNLTELDVRQNTALHLLYCYNNNLTALDVSQNPALTDLACSNNTYSIALTGGTFDLGTLPGTFNVSKASNWTNATVDGNTLTVTDPKTDVTYTYDLGNGKTETFTLHPTSCTLTESMVETIPVQSHTGSEVTPDVTLKCGDTILQKNTNYTISYASNIEIGTAKVTITGMGFFTGEITVPFEIGVAIDAKNFPDEIFRTYVQENFDTTADGILSKEEREQATYINVFSEEISDLTGVEYFTALQWLNCSGNNLKELNVRQNIALQLLYCYDNQLTELDVSQNMALKELYCFGNQLTELDLDQNLALQVLNCSSNQLRELDVSQNTALQTLYCDSNDLTKLDVRQNSELQILGCYDNQLKELDVSQNTALKELYCHNNNLTELDLSQNPALTSLLCYKNTYSIALTGGTFDLGTLPGTFDVSKASNWTNATVDGNTLTVTDPKTDVTYTYDLGNGKTETFTLHPTSCTLTESMAEAIPDQIYTGSELKPEVTWKHAVKDTDYTISYKDNIDAGTATVTITGKKFWEGSITISFTILPADLTDAEIKLKEEKLVYNGTEQSPSIESITVGDRVLTEDDYTIIGNTATESGTYTLAIQGKGNFTGKATAEWSIVKATPSVTPVIPDQKYTEGDNLPELGYKCSVDGVITWITNLEKGLIEGENELEWRFTPDDANNYETVTGTALIVAETTTTTTTTTSTTTTTTATTTTTNPTTTKPITTSTTKSVITTTATKPVTTSTTKAVVTTTATKPVTTTTTKAVVTTTATKPVTTTTTKAVVTTTATKPVTTTTTKAATTTTATKPVTTSTTKAVVTTTATKPVTTSTTKAVATTTTTKPVTTSTTKAVATTITTKPVTTSTTKAATTTTATKPVTTSTTKVIVTTTTTKPVTTSTTKAVATTTATKPVTTSTTMAVATTTATKPITTTTKPVTTIQTTTSTNETTTKATLTTTTAQTTTRTNATTTTTQATTTSTTTNATTTTMHATTATTSTVETTTTTMKPATITTTESTTTNVVTTTMQSTTTTAATTTTTASTTTTTLLTTTSSVVSTTTTPVVTTVPTTTTGETSIVVVPKEADFYFAEDTTTFTPGDLFESITLIQEDGTEVDITDQITLPEVSPSTVETDEQHRAILPVFYQDELLTELTVPVYIGKKGDIDLDGDVTLADATLALTYYSEHAVNNDFYFTTQSAQAPQTEAEQMLEKLMFFLADIDTESKQGADTDNGMIELLDATRILTYYAEQAVGNLPSWSN